MVQFVPVGLGFQTLIVDVNIVVTWPIQISLELNRSLIFILCLLLPGFLSTPGLQLLHILEFVNRIELIVSNIVSIASVQ